MIFVLNYVNIRKSTLLFRCMFAQLLIRLRIGNNKFCSYSKKILIDRRLSHKKN